MNNDEIKSNETVPPVSKTDGTFPEPNTPPYYYAKIGEIINVQNNDRWYIQFVNVLEDTRCPRGSNCAAAGPAIVQVQIVDKNTRTYAADLVELKAGDNVRFPQDSGQLYEPAFMPVLVQRKSPDGNEINWKVSLRDLVPYPTGTGAEVKAEDYVGLFHVEILKP